MGGSEQMYYLVNESSNPNGIQNNTPSAYIKNMHVTQDRLSSRVPVPVEVAEAEIREVGKKKNRGLEGPMVMCQRVPACREGWYFS